MFECKSRALLPVTCLLVASACGGGGGSAPAATPPIATTPPPPPPTSIDLTSDTGDYIGAGQSYSYTQADAVITVTVSDAQVSIQVAGNESWSADFILPNTYTQFEVGTYTNLARYPVHDPAVGGLSWTGEGRGCNTLTGTLTVEEVVYEGMTLVGFDLQFEQYCEGETVALRGDIHWDSDDATAPPGPVVSPPAGLWSPPDGATPVTGNFVYLESDSGDYIGAGQDYSYTSANARITVNSGNAHFSVSIDGDERWNGDFQAMSVIDFVEAGFYDDLQRYPFHNPVKGGLSWSGEGRGCNRLTGWFMVDSVTYNGNTLAAVDLRFEQHCEGGGPALHGAIRWDVDDDTSAPGPVVPAPAGLWEPPEGATPTTSNYVYLESDVGDYIGAGQTNLYTSADAVFTVTSTAAHFKIRVDGDDEWKGSFEGMDSLLRLEVGYYGDLERHPFHNPVKGGLSWTGEGRGCNTLTGWFVVDSVTYDGDILSAVDLRFEQHCEGSGPALKGEIHWDANDTTAAPGPDPTPPAGLWEPLPGITPATGNYIYIESDIGDWVGQGQNYLYTPLDSIITASQPMLGGVQISVHGDELWSGNFEPMNLLTLLEAGYYGDVQQFPTQNPTKAGLNWSGEGRACGAITGWLMVDSVTYSGSTVMAIDLRFEQSCDGVAMLHGEIHWDANDTTAAPGPVLPIPAGLWEPTPGVVPTTGNYVYLESDSGDFIGRGENYLYTQADSTLSFGTQGARLTVTVAGDENWRSDFEGMESIPQLEVGYYGDLQGHPFHNPAKGGLSWSGEGRGCNTLTGWFAVDSVTYDGNILSAIDLRFEQHCDGGPALNGEIHWDASDNTAPAGPVLPIPAGLWAPAPGITPATGNYVYLESDIGDWVGQGANYLYDDNEFSVTAPGAQLDVDVGGAERWSGIFQAMNTLNYLEAGYYGNLQRYPLHNAVIGGLSWTGEGRGCNQLSGWFAIDSVTYNGVILTGIDLRFEQSCDGGPPLNGEMHWRE